MVGEGTIPGHLNTVQFGYDPNHLSEDQVLQHPVAAALDNARRLRTFHGISGGGHSPTAILNHAAATVSAGHMQAQGAQS